MDSEPGNGGSVDPYREKYVTFIDLLGFSQLVNSDDLDNEKRRDVIKILGHLRDSLCENQTIGVRLRQFSDCIVISADRTPAGLREMLASILCLTFNLLQSDVLLRGGLAVGGIHHDDTLLFGVGLNEAYQLEHCKALHPRIVVDDKVLADIKAAQLDNLVRQDADGCHT